MKKIETTLRNTLSIKERQEILNNGCAGMRSLMFYLDSIANAVDGMQAEKQVAKQAESLRKAK